MIARTGELTRSNMTSQYEIVGDLPDGTVLVRHEFDHDFVNFARELIVGDTLVSLCRCEHRYENTGAQCAAARDKLRDIRAEEARQRIALLPAPDGARYLRHCGGYWPAKLGGACPQCGAVGEKLTPTARVSGNKSYGFTNVHTDVGVHHALEDLGVTPQTARQIGTNDASVRTDAGLTAKSIAETLRAKGWSIEGARRSA